MNPITDPLNLAIFLTTGHALDVRRQVFECADLALLDEAASLIQPEDGDERLAGWIAARRAVLAVLVTTARVAAGLEEPTIKRRPAKKTPAKPRAKAPPAIVGHQQRLLSSPAAG